MTESLTGFLVCRKNLLHLLCQKPVPLVIYSRISEGRKKTERDLDNLWKTAFKWEVVFGDGNGGT